MEEDLLSTLSVRPYETETTDLKQALAVEQACFPEYPNEAEYFEDPDEKTVHFVIETRGKIVAILTLRNTQLNYGRKTNIELQSIAVSPDYQGKHGIGKTIISALCQIANESTTAADIDVESIVALVRKKNEVAIDHLLVPGGFVKTGEQQYEGYPETGAILKYKPSPNRKALELEMEKELRALVLRWLELTTEEFPPDSFGPSGDGDIPSPMGYPPKQPGGITLAQHSDVTRPTLVLAA